MKNVLEYKGYHAIIEYDADGQDLFGKVIDVKDLIIFSADTPKDVVNEFRKTIDEYLEVCKEAGLKPEKEYKGSFNIRIAPAKHRKLAIIAEQNNRSINSCVDEAIDYYLKVHA